MSFLSQAAVMFLLFAICFAGPAVVPINPATGLVIPAVQLAPKPYEFGYEFGDGLGMAQHRREVSDGAGTVKGSYGYIDPLGVTRIVDYTANSDGYRAVVRSNEPGMLNQSPADALFIVQPPPLASVNQRLIAA